MIRTPDKYPFRCLPRKKKRSMIAHFKEHSVTMIWYYCFTDTPGVNCYRMYFLLMQVDGHVIPYYYRYTTDPAGTVNPDQSVFQSLHPSWIKSVYYIFETTSGSRTNMINYLLGYDIQKLYDPYDVANMDTDPANDFFQYIYYRGGTSSGVGTVSVYFTMEQVYKKFKEKDILDSTEEIKITLGNLPVIPLTDEELQIQSAQEAHLDEEMAQNTAQMIGEPFQGPQVFNIDQNLWFPGSYEETPYHRYYTYEGNSFYGPKNCKVNDRQGRIYHSYNVVIYNLAADTFNEFYFVYPKLQTSVLTAEKEYTQFKAVNWDSLRGAVIQRWNPAEKIRIPYGSPTRVWERYKGFINQGIFLSPMSNNIDDMKRPLWCFVMTKDIAEFVGKQCEYNGWLSAGLHNAVSTYYLGRGL